MHTHWQRAVLSSCVRLLRASFVCVRAAAAVCVHAQAVYILVNRCAYPRNVTLSYLFYIISLLVLFLRFYFKSFGKKAKAAKAE
jgi:hypothetical protein